MFDINKYHEITFIHVYKNNKKSFCARVKSIQFTGIFIYIYIYMYKNN